MEWNDGDGDDGATAIFRTARRRFRNGMSAWRLPVLDWEVGEDDGDVGYLPVPSAWTEERHGVLPTATLLRGTPGKREKLGRESVRGWAGCSLRAARW